MAREGLVVRSLVFPVALTVLTLFATIGAVILFRPPGIVALRDDPELVSALAEKRLVPLVVDDPERAVRDGVARVGTDGRTVWMLGEGPEARVTEAILRDRVHARWVPSPNVNLPRGAVARAFGSRLATLMAGVFALYGVVFGAGMVMRDRDDGTLEAERSLPVHAWMHGAARWIAGTLCLAAFLALSLLVFDALVGVDDIGALFRNGAAGAGAATALGLVSVRREGASAGFGGALALGLVLTSALMAAGVLAPGVGRWLPLGSIAAGGSGWAPVAGMLVLGIVAAAWFDRQVRT
jgi:hypothetical protein